ncbi:protein-L-isoaspartate(D-aspartate) O-methyltransferase [Anditalea andensis]|uniref:Protein-L-isoaspartate O-methyltransferase n=1 Tax=Anditalea andensis TaxID=1048983 RepID=A0A074L3S0_9BACT|nr:protein-L-isoaspartate(D-aspartate) O-methyltransferase [Anditalea andensis]KEO75829.1 protein-L-isoaspartate O-methyltransferase [Anditalea andensis]
MKWMVIIFLISFFQKDQYRSARDRMVKTQIDDRGIKNPLILEAMRKVPRHLLVPQNQRGNAYLDRPLAIGNGQTISQPYIVAYMTHLLEPIKGMKVLEIGTGSGYQAAVLAEIVSEVYTVEIIEKLGRQAERDLKKIGYENIHVKIGDGYTGWEEHAPFDAILVTAAASQIPQPLIDQLKVGGRMIIPVGPLASTQKLIMVEKTKHEIKTKDLMPVRFVPFTRTKL